MKPITLEEAKALTHNTILYHRHNKNADKTSQRWKVNGKVKRWKRQPDRIEVPMKHGLWMYGTLTDEDLSVVSLSEK